MIKEILRRTSLKRWTSQQPTGILPLRDIRTAVAFLDAQDPDWELCKNRLMAFFRQYGIRADIYFFDFRKLEKDERLITGVGTTFLQSDLNWFGCPVGDKVSFLLATRPDLFLSLLPGAPYPLEFLARACPSRFKVGREQLSGQVFDLVVLDPSGPQPLSQADAFAQMIPLLEKLQ